MDEVENLHNEEEVQQVVDLAEVARSMLWLDMPLVKDILSHRINILCYRKVLDAVQDHKYIHLSSFDLKQLLYRLGKPAFSIGHHIRSKLLER